MKYIIIIAMTMISAFASYFLKRATAEDKVYKIFLSIYFYLGGFLYVTAVFFNIWLLQILPYAVILPVGSITYIWTMVISKKMLKEQITSRKILGICFIIGGVIFVAIGSR